MNTNLARRNTIIGLVAGTIGHSTFAAGDPLLSIVNDAPVQRAEVIFRTDEKNVQSLDISQSVSESNSTPDSRSNREYVRLGVLSDIKSAKGVAHILKKDANTTDTVEQGNISGSVIGGGFTQKFIGTVGAKKDVVELPSSVSAPQSIPQIVTRSYPEIARGYEAIYDRFMRGSLIYRPTAGSDVGKIELSITDLLVRGDNSLERTFDLSRCGDAGRYLSISTGYRRAVKPENSRKWEIFITPKFLVERNAGKASHHYSVVVGGWTSPISIIQNYGGWSDLSWYWHHGTLSENDLNAKNLYQICAESTLINNSIPLNLAPQEFMFNFS